MVNKDEYINACRRFGHTPATATSGLGGPAALRPLMQ